MNPAQNLISNIYSDLAKRGSNIMSAVQAGAQNLNSNQNPLQKGLNIAGTGLQTAGQVAGGAFDIAKGALSPITNTANALGTKIGNAIGGTQAAQNILNSPFVDTLYAGGTDIAHKLGALKQDHPEAVKNLEAAGNIIALLLANKSSNQTMKNPSNMPNQQGGFVKNPLNEAEGTNGEPGGILNVDKELGNSQPIGQPSPTQPPSLVSHASPAEVPLVRSMASDTAKVVSEGVPQKYAGAFVDTQNTVNMYDKYISTGDMPAAKVYSDVPNKVFTPEVATQIISNEVNKFGKLGIPPAMIQGALNPNNLTPTGFIQTMKNVVGGYLDKTGAMIIDPAKRNLGAAAVMAGVNSSQNFNNSTEPKGWETIMNYDNLTPQQKQILPQIRALYADLQANKAKPDMAKVAQANKLIQQYFPDMYSSVQKGNATIKNTDYIMKAIAPVMQMLSKPGGILGKQGANVFTADPAVQAWMKVVPTKAEQQQLGSYGKIPALDYAMQHMGDLVGSLVLTASNPAQAASRFYNFVNAVAGKVDKSIVKPLFDLVTKKAQAAGKPAMQPPIFSSPSTTKLAGGQPAVAAWDKKLNDETHLPEWTTIPGGTWISDKYKIDDPYASHTNFYHTGFDINGDVPDAPDKAYLLTLAADNTYTVYINGKQVRQNLGEYNYRDKDVKYIDIRDYLQSGHNTMLIQNDNIPLPTYIPAGPEINPVGVNFRLDVPQGTMSPPLTPTPPPTPPTPTPTPSPTPTPTPGPTPTPTPTPSPTPTPTPTPPKSPPWFKGKTFKEWEV